MLRNPGRRQRIQEFSWMMYCLLSIHDCVNWVIGLRWSFKFWKNKIFISSICSLEGDSITLSWNQFSLLVDMLLISGYTFSVNSSTFFTKTQKLLRVIKSFTLLPIWSKSIENCLLSLLDKTILIFVLSLHFVICGQRYDLLCDALTSSVLVPSP